MPLKSFITLFFLTFAGLLPAQRNPQPYFRNYSTEDGLPSPEVYCAFEDSKGYMWFGTDNGAARFDGYEFKTYGPEEGLMSNVVFDFKEDSEGRIWFATMTGDAYILEGDTIRPYEFNDLVYQFDNRYMDGRLAHVYEDGKTLFALKGFGFLMIDTLGNIDTLTGRLVSSNLVLYDHDFSQTEWISNSKVHHHLFDSVYISHASSLYTYYEIYTDDKIIQKKLSTQSGSGHNSEVAKLKTGEYIIYANGNLHCLSDTNLLWTIEHYPGTNEITHEMDGGIWFCQRNKVGLRRYNSLKDLQSLRFQEYLSGYSISQILIDSKKNLWVTTAERGVFRCSNLDLITYDKKTGLSDNYVITAAIPNDSIIYLGTHDGNIYMIQAQKNIILKQMRSLYPFDRYSLLFDKSSETLYHGLSRLKSNKWDFPVSWQPNYKKYRRYHHANMDKTIASSTDLLVGCTSFGFLVLDKNKHQVILQSIYFKRERTYAIHSDHTDRLWLGLANGLFWFNFADSTYLPAGPAHPAFHHRVEDIDGMPDSTLVFGTKGFGVIFWKGDSVLQVSDNDGLTTNMLEDVHVDENGICWAGTLNGLNKITFAENGQPVVRTFTMQNGLPSNEIYQIKSHEGQVWLCTAGGLVKFNERPENTDSPSPLLQWVKVNGSENDYAINTAYQHNDNNFEFRYLTINYRMDGRIPYRYRLHKNDDWQYTQNLTANYPALPPGHFNFEVQAQNEDGYWSDSTTYAFSVLPPWWATWWFRGLAGAALGLAGFGFYKYRTGQLKRENEMQRQITELEKSALQAQMNPHFIFNCLNSIQNFILQNDQQKAVQYLARFAKLVRYNLEASIRGQVSLEEEIRMLDNYLALEQERHNQAFDYDITVDSKLRDDFIEFPSMLIQPFVENAVLHGMAGKTGGGKVAIYFSRSNGQVQVTVRDNGGGFRQNGAEEKTPRHKSAGMSITQKRLELLGADASDAIQIKQTTNENGEVTGTEVNVFIQTKTL